MRRFLMLAAALALCFLGASALPAYAEETPPAAGSSPGDPFGGQTLEPGPVFLITPGGPTSTGLPAPADPEDVEEAIREDAEKNGTPGVTPSALPSAAGGTPTDGATPGATATDAAGTPGSAATEGRSTTDSSSPALWWILGAAVLLAALAAVVVLRRRRDRAPGGSLTDHAP